MRFLLIMAVAVCVGDAKYLLVDIQEGAEGEARSIGLRGGGQMCWDECVWPKGAPQPWCLKWKRLCKPGGRPFIVHEASRTTISKDYSIEKGKGYAASWKMGAEPSVAAGNPHNEEIGRQWLKIAEAEHASIASFTRFALQLMSLGSPSGLLVSSQEAEIDEINHAKLAYKLASTFLGSDYGPGPLDVKGSLDDVSLKYIVRSLIQEGCIEETISAIEAHIAAHHAQDLAAKTARTKMASDETRHAQLAWDALHWIIETFPEIFTFVQDTFEAELKQQYKSVNNDVSVTYDTACKKENCESEKNNLFRKYGITLKQDQEKARSVGIQTVIAPVYHAGLEDVSLISKKITELEINRIFE